MTTTAALLTVKEAAKQLAVHPDTVRRLIDRHELPSVRIGRNVRISVADLHVYLNRSRTARVVPVGKATIGQLRAFHAKCDRLDDLLSQPRKTTKRALLAMLEIESADDLDERVAHEMLNELERRLEQAPRAPA